MNDKVVYLHRQHRPNLAPRPANDGKPELDWSLSSAFWGACLGFYAGMIATAGLAYIWGLFL